MSAPEVFHTRSSFVLGPAFTFNFPGRRRAERAEHVEAGRLPGSSPYPYDVALGVDMVWCGSRVGSAILNGLEANVAATLAATVEGAHRLWFNATGDAFLSFEIEGDAVLFRLALDGAV